MLFLISFSLRNKRFRGETYKMSLKIVLTARKLGRNTKTVLVCEHIRLRISGGHFSGRKYVCVCRLKQCKCKKRLSARLVYCSLITSIMDQFIWPRSPIYLMIFISSFQRRTSFSAVCKTFVQRIHPGNLPYSLIGNQVHVQSPKCFL